MNQFFDPHLFPSPLGSVPSWSIEGPTGPHFFGSDRFALSATTDLSLREKEKKNHASVVEEIATAAA